MKEVYHKTNHKPHGEHRSGFFVSIFNRRGIDMTTLFTMKIGAFVECVLTHYELPAHLGGQDVEAAIVHACKMAADASTTYDSHELAEGEKAARAALEQHNER